MEGALNSQQQPQILSSDELEAISGGETTSVIGPNFAGTNAPQSALVEQPPGAPTPGPLPNI